MATGDAAGPFEFIDKSIHDHRRIRIASSESKCFHVITSNYFLANILAVGKYARHGLAEIYQLDISEWQSVTPFPFEGDFFIFE